ncbi:hypothetical protein CsatB_030744 [Cannabis sativa]
MTKLPLGTGIQLAADPELPPFHTNYKNPKHNSSAVGITGYAYEDIYEWFVAGLDDHNLFPPSVDLQPLSVESAFGNVVQRLALFNNTDSDEKLSSNRLTKSLNRGPWEYIAENSPTPTPKPELPPFHTNYKNPKHNSSAVGITGYAYEDIYEWFVAGLDDHNLFPPSVDLQPLSVESAFGNVVQRLALFNNTDSDEKR